MSESNYFQGKFCIVDLSEVIFVNCASSTITAIFLKGLQRPIELNHEPDCSAFLEAYRRWIAGQQGESCAHEWTMAGVGRVCKKCGEIER